MEKASRGMRQQYSPFCVLHCFPRRWGLLWVDARKYLHDVYERESNSCCSHLRRRRDSGGRVEVVTFVSVWYVEVPSSTSARLLVVLAPMSWPIHSAGAWCVGHSVREYSSPQCRNLPISCTVRVCCTLGNKRNFSGGSTSVPIGNVHYQNPPHSQSSTPISSE